MSKNTTDVGLNKEHGKVMEKKLEEIQEGSK